MDHVDPVCVTRAMIEAVASKIKLPAGQRLLPGFLSGALLGFATSRAFVANSQALPPIPGAIIFPVGFAMIVVLGLELVTGSFALIPLTIFEGQSNAVGAAVNLMWAFAGNLLGGV